MTRNQKVSRFMQGSPVIVLFLPGHRAAASAALLGWNHLRSVSGVENPSFRMRRVW